jgi:5'-nucleotidase
MEGLDPSIDVIVSGHTNGIYICRMSGHLLTSASQYGALLTDIAITIDRRTGDVIASGAQNFVVADTLAEDIAQAEHIAAYRALAAPMMSRPVGALATPLTRTPTPSGESPMGLVIADSMLASAASALGHPVDVAFMNPGGVRASLDHPGAITLSELFSVTPILQISEGSSFAWRSGPGGGVVAPGSVQIAGAPLNRARTYRVVTNTFLASGGDGFTGFTVGRGRTVVSGDLDALEAYFGAHSPVGAPAMPRARAQ